MSTKNKPASLEKPEDWFSKNWQAWALIGIIFLWGLTFLTFVIFKKSDERGQFGDVFGAVNALFSGLAFWGLIITIRQQKKEIEDTKDDLKSQRFENTFFQMLSLHHGIIDKLNYTYSYMTPMGGVETEKYEKREVFEVAKRSLLFELKKKNEEYFAQAENKDKQLHNSIEITDLEESYKSLCAGYIAFYKQFEANLSHYYRNLYHIFKVIHESNFLLEDEKKRYAGIVRAQLSHDEQLILYYNAMVQELGNPKFLYLVERFDLMQNFGKHPLEEYGNHEEIFSLLSYDVTLEHYKTDKVVELRLRRRETTDDTTP